MCQTLFLPCSKDHGAAPAAGVGSVVASLAGAVLVLAARGLWRAARALGVALVVFTAWAAPRIGRGAVMASRSVRRRLARRQVVRRTGRAQILRPAGTAITATTEAVTLTDLLQKTEANA